MMDLVKIALEFIKEFLCNFWHWITGTSILAIILWRIIPDLFSKWISATLSKGGKPMYKRLHFLEYIKAHPTLIPISLLSCVFLTLCIITYCDTRVPTEPPAPTPEQKDSSLDLSDCTIRNLPELPCFWIALESEGDSPKTIAEDAYGDVIYEGVEKSGKRRK